LIIANGRISDRSFRRYQWIRPFLKQVLGNVTHFLMQSAQDAERISTLGAPSTCVSVGGNIKYDLGGELAAQPNLARELTEALNLAKDGLLLVAGSTATGEELLLLNAYQQLLYEPALANTRLLLAPRHPERFEEVATLIKAHRLPFIRRSELASNVIALNGKSELPSILLLDSIGELAATYCYADLVFVGGSLVPRGGHNILEPALYGRAIITGPYMYNFRHIMQDFISAKAVIQVDAEQGALEQALFTALLQLLTDQQLREELGERALAVLKSNRGALEKHTQLITKLIEIH
jgi:3-deoxy-D-manno-octulosonic-acid transferase